MATQRTQWGQEIVPYDVAVPNVGYVAVDVSPIAIVDAFWHVAVNTLATAPIAGRILVDGNEAAVWNLPAGQYSVQVPATRNLRRNSAVVLQITSHPDYVDAYGMSVYCTGNAVS
jgi:hypothetical protein